MFNEERRERTVSNLVVRNCFLALTATVTLLGSGDSSATINATGTGQWISIGVPSDVWLGTNGQFYLRGTDTGTCQSVLPSYFRIDTSQPKWKEMYALLLYTAANQKAIACVVDSGCGTSEVWVSYCNSSL
jgi:hypothetical protein